MHIKFRRIIISVFLLAFFVIGPLLLLYSSGYRFDLKRGKVVQTGNIFVEAKDLSLATIYLNDEKYKEPLTKKLFINNLLPGDYNLSVEKEDRYTWAKKVHVDAGLTTFILDLHLFLKQEPIIEVPGEIEEMVISPDGQRALYVKTSDSFRELFVRTLINSEDELIYRASTKTEFKYAWAPSSNKILVVSGQTATVFSSKAPFTSQLIPLPTQTAKATWDNEKDTLVYAITAQKIYEYNTLTKKTNILFETDESINPDILTFGTSTYLLEKDGTEALVQQVNDGQIVQTIARIPWSAEYIFGESTLSFLTIENKSLNKIYLINRSTDPGTELLQDKLIVFDAETATFSPDKSKLLLYDEFEIKYFDFITRQLRIITRFGSSIRSAIWYSDNQHVILTLDTQLIISDLYTNYANSQISLINNSTNLHSASLVERKTIYFTGTTNGKTGLYSLRIK